MSFRPQNHWLFRVILTADLTSTTLAKFEQKITHGVCLFHEALMRNALVCFVLMGMVACGDDGGKSGPDIVIDANNTQNNVATNNVATNNTANNNAQNNPTNNAVNNNTTNNLVREHFTLPFVGFGDPQVRYTPDGVAHFVYNHGAAPAQLVYGQCMLNCGVEEGWAFVELASANLLDDSQLESDASGRLHLVYSILPPGLGATQTFYATCASSCTNAASWATVDLTPALDGTWSVYRGSPMAVSANGGVYLATTDGSTNARVFLTQCLGNCHDGNNWSAGLVRNGGRRAAMVVAGTKLHQVIDNETGGLIYRTCASNCTNPQNWQESPQLFAFDGNGQVRLAVVGSELRLVYNQGQVTDPTPEVAAQNGRILYWTCSSNCLDPAGWSGTLLANPNDGFHLDMATAGDATVLAFAADNLDYTVMVCLGDCQNPDSWGATRVDSTEQMVADFDPYLVLCGGATPNFAAWYVESPSLAISATSGDGLFASVGGLLRKCTSTGQFSKTSGMGRLILLK